MKASTAGSMGVRAALGVVALALALVMSAPLPASADPGDLDASFGDMGRSGRTSPADSTSPGVS